MQVNLSEYHQKQRQINRSKPLSPMIKAMFFALFLAGCSSPFSAIDTTKIDAPKQEESPPKSSAIIPQPDYQPHYKIGNPYQIEGIWYYPERNLTYDNTGIASWYGDQFAGKLTANGEIFSPDLVSAAHKTLPMPSVVRVTNLDNGKAMVVRINDRGPYVSGRIIDLSREAARLLGFKEQGIARVRVKILVEQSLRLEKMAKNDEFPLLVDAQDALPETIAAERPSVSLSAKTTREIAPKKIGTSALELLSSSRIGSVIDTAPQITQIWIQIGAFYSEDNAQNIIKTFADISSGSVFQVAKDGRILHRARLGPVQSVAQADSLLSQIYQRGFDGAEIVVD